MTNQWRVLIVEDEDGLRRSLRVFLEDEGFKVAAAGSGEEGLELLQTFHPHAAVVDMRLPAMDGNAFILQAHARDSQMRFVICTGSTLYEITQELMAIGLNKDLVLRKPLKDMSVLSALLRNVLEASAQS